MFKELPYQEINKFLYKGIFSKLHIVVYIQEISLNNGYYVDFTPLFSMFALGYYSEHAIIFNH